MQNATEFRKKLQHGQVCLGTVITTTDSTVSECLSDLLDFIWIDTEHSGLSLETVQLHLMATRGTDAATLVRVPWNDPVRIKPVLDVGADGVIVPLIRSADEARQAVAACRYPPQGIRGFGPRRTTQFGGLTGAEYCRAANEAMLTFVQIEHRDAVEDLDAILAVENLTGILIGPNDLAGSLGHMGEPRHPEVLKTVESILTKAVRAGVPAGIAVGAEPGPLMEWIDKGATWLAMGTDLAHLMRAATQLVNQLRQHAGRKGKST